MIGRVRRLLRRWPSAVGALAVLVSGCGYHSQYVPPQDGRARAVWQEDNVAAALPGAAPPPACVDEVQRLILGGPLQLATGTFIQDGYWQASYYGPPIVVYSPGLAPPLPAPPLYRPRSNFVPVDSHVGGSLLLRSPVSRGGGGGGSISGGGGGGGKGGEGLVILAVILLIVLPAIDLGMAIDNPESPSRSSPAIDAVNAYNDLARWPGSPCYVGYPPGGPM
jgi:hypothetical protein